MKKEKIIKHWNNHPMTYNKYSMKKMMWFAQKKGKPLFSNYIPYHKIKNKKVLVIGCGTGIITKELVKFGCNVTAIDISLTAIKLTKQLLTNHNLKAKVLIADAEKLPFKTNTFDYVWCCGVLHHTPNTQKGVNEINRVLKVGGQTGVLLYHKHSLFYYGHILLYRGILQGKLKKHTKQELLNMYTDHSEVGGTPLAKCYSKWQVQKLFKEFNITSITTNGLKDEICVIKPFRKWMYKLPDWFFNLILYDNKLGWYIIIEAKKMIKERYIYDTQCQDCGLKNNFEAVCPRCGSLNSQFIG